MYNITRNIEEKWIKNFKNSPLVDKKNNVFLSSFAYQLFYGKQDDNYPDEYPDNFSDFCKNCDLNDLELTAEILTEYLHFIGITLKKELIINHIEKFPEDLLKIKNKTYYILKALAHSDDNLNIENPYYDNIGDIFFLLRIESEESLNGGQLNLFEDLSLPDLYNKVSSLPVGYENDTVIKKLFENIENTNESFFITGKAGTGKSTFVHYFAKKTKKDVILLAFTGIAAINIGGQTIHSFFRFPLKPLMPEDDEITIFKEYSQKYKIIQNIETIVIDEVSMLRSDIIEAIDYSLRKNGGDPNKKFGGKQILFVGDIFQLPPVINSTDDVEKFLFSEVYKSEYFFDSISYKTLDVKYFEFNKSHRQKDDMYFIDLLDKVRTCDIDEQTLNKLNERYVPDYIPKLDEFIINLTANNAIANAENNKKLSELNNKEYYFEAKIEGEFKEDKYPTTKNLLFKKNAQIIFIKNDSDRRWVNGTIAKIDFISNDFIEVKLQDGNIYKLEPVTWENRNYKYDKNNRKIVSELVGTFTQFPIKLAWAITIHKSQGLTFDNIIIDLGSGAFVNGQIYTALSRCKTLKGIILKRKIRSNDIITDNRILSFYKSNSNPSISNTLSLKENKLEIEQNESEILIPYRIDDKWGYVNRQKNVRIPIIYDFADRFYNDLAVVKLDLWGFIDKTGKEVISCKYDYVNLFSDGLAAIKLNNKWGFIDKTGSEVFSCKYDHVELFIDGLAKVCNYENYYQDEDGYYYDSEWGFIDKTGKEVIPCKYDETDLFYEGLAAIKLNNKWGFIDKTGIEVTSCQYDCVERFFDGLALVSKGGTLDINNNLRDSKSGYIDKNGNEVISCKYSSAYSFIDGLARVKINNKWGLIDRNGIEIIPSRYDDILEPSEGVFAIQLNNKWGFIDKTGYIIIPLKYENAHSYSEGLAVVELNNKWGLIDKSGDVIIPFKYEEISTINKGLIKVKLNEYYGFIDRTEKIVIDFSYKYIDVFSEGLAKFIYDISHNYNNIDDIYETEINGGFIDKTGKVVYSFSCYKIGEFINGLAKIVTYHGETSADLWGYIDLDGNEYFEDSYY